METKGLKIFWNVKTRWLSIIIPAPQAGNVGVLHLGAQNVQNLY